MTPFQERQLVLMRQMESSLASDHSASTIVPIQADYQNDPQIALTCISYIPSDLAASIQTQLIEQLQTIEPDFFYYPNEALHITIQNVRVIHNPPRFTDEDVKKVQMVLSKMVSASAPFEFEYAGLLSMPTSVSLIALVSPAYDQFVKTLRHALNAAGVPDDKTYFTDQIIFANTSICRYTHAPSQKFLKKLEECKDISFGKLTPKTVSVVTMNAVANPKKTVVHGTYDFASKKAI